MRDDERPRDADGLHIQGGAHDLASRGKIVPAIAEVERQVQMVGPAVVGNTSAVRHLSDQIEKLTSIAEVYAANHRKTRRYALAGYLIRGIAIIIIAWSLITHSVDIRGIHDVIVDHDRRIRALESGDGGSSLGGWAGDGYIDRGAWP